MDFGITGSSLERRGREAVVHAESMRMGRHANKTDAHSHIPPTNSCTTNELVVSSRAVVQGHKTRCGQPSTKVPEQFRASMQESSVCTKAARARATRAREGGVRGPRPKGIKRASAWSTDVENAFRLQCAGWRSAEEYAGAGYPEIEVWDKSEFIKSLRVKENGNFMYFRSFRECEEKYLSRVKIFLY